MKKLDRRFVLFDFLGLYRLRVDKIYLKISHYYLFLGNSEGYRNQFKPKITIMQSITE